MNLDQLAKASKALGGSIAALGLSVAGVQNFVAPNSKIGLYVAGAGILIHAASTACENFGNLVLTIKGIFNPAPQIVEQPPVQTPNPPIQGA